jgi:prenyl protein peptidase
VAYTLVYVVPFYLSSTTRPSSTLTRDAPSVIRARIRSVTVSCIVCSISSFLVVRAAAASDGAQISSSWAALHHLGYFPVGFAETVNTLMLTAALFMGPLFEAGIVEGRWKDWVRLRDVDVLSSWPGWRNLVAVSYTQLPILLSTCQVLMSLLYQGPVTEEILFRSASVPLLLLSGASTTTIVFLTPIVFGLAHVHHFYEFRITHPHTPIVQAVLRSVLQFTYTTLFGGYATFLFLRTGSLLSVVLVHAFCNWIGFPRFWGKVSAGETVLGPDYGEGNNGESSSSVRGSEWKDLAWTVAYYTLLVVGAVSWWNSLWTWTESESALMIF